jgi:hypothetical protein
MIDIPRRPIIDAQAPLSTDLSTRQRRQRSWWTSVYDRISQSSQDSQWEQGLNTPSAQNRRTSNSRRQRPLSYGEADLGFLSAHGHDLDDSPPPSVIRTHHSQYRSTRAPPNAGEDVLTPLPILDKRQPRNLQLKQAFNNSVPDSIHGNIIALHYPTSSGVRDGSSVFCTPVQAPADSLFGRVFPSSSSHGTKNFDATYPVLEESSRSQSTSMSSVTPERVVSPSQAKFGFDAAPDGLTAGLVTFPSSEPHHEISKFSRSDSWHRREAAFLHPPFPSSFTRSGTLPNVSNGNHHFTQSDPWETSAAGHWHSSKQSNVHAPLKAGDS